MEEVQVELPPSFDNYKSLITTVVAKHFTSTANDRAGAYDLDDLRQEGAIALLEALETYDPNHPSQNPFWSYCYTAIFKSLVSYCQANGSPVKVAQKSDVVRTGRKHATQQSKDRYAAATRRMLLSDLDEAAWEAALADMSDPTEPIDGLDLTQHCLEALHRELDSSELAILSLWSCGAKYEEIGEMIGVKRSRAGEIVQGLLVKATGILRGEIHP
jgi:RNA polymerase sigma factor (sigma-70 family)